MDERIFISGQIGLIPSSLSLPSPKTLATEISLASQHSYRVVKALSSPQGAGGRVGRGDSDDDNGHAQLILYWVTEERHISYSIMAAQRLDVSSNSKKINLDARCFPYPRLPRAKKRKETNNVFFFFCFPIARCHADALLGCEGSSQRSSHREAGSLSYRSWTSRHR